MTSINTKLGARDQAFNTIFAPTGTIPETNVQRAIEHVMGYVLSLPTLPGSSVDNTVPRFNGTAGNLEGTAVTIDDNNFIGTLPGIGIGGATADVINRLSANTPAVLFNRETDDIQVKLNKNAAGDTASFVFQTGFSGRAEIGLVGDDDFQFKVSPDGSTFFSGIILDKDDGTVRIPLGSTLGGVIDAGGATSLELPNSAAPVVNADGEIALDTSVANFSHGLLRLFGGEEQFVISLPVAALAAPTDGHVISYNAANDEFELVAAATSGANTALSNLAAVAINTTLLPGSNDGAGLGSGTLAFSDLFLASGGTLNFNNSDVVVTHSSNLLALTGGSMVFGHTALVPTELTGTPNTLSYQMLGTNALDSSFMTGRFSNDVNGGYHAFAKSRNAAIGSHTVVQNGDILGVITWAGSDGTGFAEGARILATVSGTPGTNDMPTDLIFALSVEGSDAPTERLRLTSTGDVLLTSSGAYKATGDFPGFWLDETVGGTKGAYTVLDGGNYQIQRRATGFGAFEATLFNLNLASGAAELSGNAIRTAGRETIWVPAGAMHPSAGTTAVTNISFGTGGDLPVIPMDPSSFEFLRFAIAMPKSWNEGTINYKVYWAHPATTTNFSVVWSLEAGAFSNDDAITNNFGLAAVTDVGGTTHDLYISDESPALTVAGTPAAEDMTRFTFFRDAAHGSDTLAVDAYLIGIKIYYTTNAANDT